jgi:hypothetical protein
MSSLHPERHSPEANAHQPLSSRPVTSDADRIEPVTNVDNPFSTPGAQTPNNLSSAPSEAGSSGITSGYQNAPRSSYFKSRRVKKGEIERPWLEKKDPREKWVTIIPLVGIFIGLCVTGVLIWDGIRSVAMHNYCEVLNEEFNSWNSKIWTKEVQVGGFGYVTMASSSTSLTKTSQQRPIRAYDRQRRECLHQRRRAHYQAHIARQEPLGV